MLLNPSKSKALFGGDDDGDENVRGRLPVVVEVVTVVARGLLVTNVIKDDIPGGADCVDDGPPVMAEAASVVIVVDDDVVVSRSNWSGDGRNCCCLVLPLPLLPPH